MDPLNWLGDTNLSSLRRRVLAWYDRNGRDLPWRRTRDPYAVWISEIMLQQTTVATVLRYYPRFLARFPDAAHLAAADEQDVFHVWQGLGYYRRARHLHQAARVIVQKHAGRFPQHLEDIRSLPGVGRYTAHAIAGFALGQRLGILEANTRRLWARVTAAEGDPAKAPLDGQLWELADRVLPTQRFADFNQALMDLGARVCKPREPNCPVCPLRVDCVAFTSGQVERFPISAPRPTSIDVEHVTVVLRDPGTGEVLVTRRPDDGPWAGLWEFPRVERKTGETLKEAARRALEVHLRRPANRATKMATLKHGIMHYRVTLHCFEATLDSGDSGSASRVAADEAATRWLAVDQLPTLAFSTPQRKIVARLLDALSRAPSTRPRGRKALAP